eukprot:PLAT2494.9.p1 GENE.PLAT2494.9~~PLAT2494.9.p1  ORF type:complete len:226 (+),score=49.50 PLAT2494.9:361-1038(+)
MTAQAFGIGSLSWYFIISLNLLSVLRGDLMHRIAKRQRWFHLFVWGYSTFAVTLPLAAGASIGEIGDGTCWLSGSTNAYRGLWYIPLTVYMLFAVSLLIYALKKMGTRGGKWKRTTRRMFFFVLAFVGTWIFPTLNRAVTFFNPSAKFPLWYHMVMSFVFAGSGLINAIVWLSSPAIRDKLLSGCPCSSDDGRASRLSVAVSTTNDLEGDIESELAEGKAYIAMK